MKKLLSLALALVMLAGLAAVPAGAEELKELNTYETQARELETWNIHYSQAAADLNVLCNLIDGLLTNDPHGNLVRLVKLPVKELVSRLASFITGQSGSKGDAVKPIIRAISRNIGLRKASVTYQFTESGDDVVESQLMVIYGAGLHP